MLNGNVSGQDNRYWCSKIPHAVLHGGFLHYLKIGVWWAVSGCETIGAVFFRATQNKLMDCGIQELSIGICTIIVCGAL
jgi:hypothetical protein